jgi:ribose transport system permease protein
MKKNVLNIIKLIALPVFLFLFFSIFASGFGVHSLSIVISQSMIPTVMGLGLYVMLNAGLMDFSMGARTIFSAIIGGILAQQMGVFGLVLGCFIGGMAAAIIMALLYRWMKIPAMVISLGIVLIFEVAGAKLVGSSGYLRITEAEYFIGSYPANILIVMLVSIFAYFLYYRTRIGSYITAVGNDEKMCKNVGINADRVKFIAILLTGIFGSISGLLYICYSGSITAGAEMTSMSMVFKPIMCVILGRYLRKNLECIPLLIFIGAISFTIIFNGFVALGFSEAIQDIALGLFLIAILGSKVTGEYFSKLRGLIARA